MEKVIVGVGYENICLYYDIKSTSRSCDGKIWIDYYRVRPDPDKKTIKLLENIINENHDIYTIRLALEKVGYTTLIKFYFKEFSDDIIKDYRFSYYYYIVKNDDYNKEIYGDSFLLKGKFIDNIYDVKKYTLF